MNNYCIVHFANCYIQCDFSDVMLSYPPDLIAHIISNILINDLFSLSRCHYTLLFKFSFSEEIYMAVAGGVVIPVSADYIISKEPLIVTRLCFSDEVLINGI